MFIDFSNEVHLMILGGFVTAIAFVAGLMWIVAKSFIDKQIAKALKDNETELSEIKKDIAETNKNSVTMANQMFANINQLIGKNLGVNDD